MEQAFIEELWGLLVGAGGATVILATIMGYIKTIWKPELKWKYWLAAIPLSAAISGGILWYVNFWNFWIFLITTILIGSAQLIENNEMWPFIKKIFFLILQRAKDPKDPKNPKEK